MKTPKKPWVAFVLSMLLTGAGLAYLGKWGWAVLNLAVVVAIGFGTAMIYPDMAGPVGIGVAVGSAVLAKNLAIKMNKESLALQSTGMEPPPVIKVDSPENSLLNDPVQPIVAKPMTVVCSKCGATTEVANFCAECGSPVS